MIPPVSPQARPRRSAPARQARRLLGIALAAIFALALLASPAAANNRFVLDSAATSTGNLAEDSAGDAYVGWMDENVPKFCKIPAGGTCTSPQTLSLAGAGLDIPTQLHPVLGSGTTVYVVGPSYDGDAVDIWTSTNGGASFGNPLFSTGGIPNGTEPNSVLLSGSNFLLGSSHPGVGFGQTPVNGSTGSSFSFAAPSGPYTLQANLGLAAPGDPVEVWWEYINSAPINFSRYKGSGSPTTEADWTSPALVAKGEVPRLSGGTSGLFLLSNDFPSGGPEADQVDVRKYSTAAFDFGSPLTLSGGPSYDTQTGGAIAQSPSGLVAVAWPRRSGETGTMDLYVSSNGGASFGAATAIANIAPDYETGDNAQLTVNDSGGGWLTYVDEGGLEVADLSALPAPPSGGSGSTPAPGTTTTTKTAPKPYTGATTTTSVAVGGELLTLKVPKACLAAAQPFYVGVGKMKRHGIAKQLHTQINVTKITFTFDKLKKKLKKKPFRWLIKPPALLAGHDYLVKALVTVAVTEHGKKKTLEKTLKGKVSIC